MNLIKLTKTKKVQMIFIIKKKLKWLLKIHICMNYYKKRIQAKLKLKINKMKKIKLEIKI